jgi:hypothetical protein
MIQGWIGGGIAGTGAAMQFMAQRKREKATNRVAGQMRAAGEAVAAENFQISDNLRKALESIATERGGLLRDYFQRRVSPERVQAAEQARAARSGTAQGGLDRALAALRGPEGAYEPQARPYQQSQEGFMENREQPMLQAVLDQIAAEGYLTGGRNYDTQNQQTLALAQRPLDNEAELRSLLTGVRQAETQYDFNRLMYDLGLAMEEAQKKGAKEAFWGSILQNIGTGVAGGTNFTYASDTTGRTGTTGGLPATGGSWSGQPGGMRNPSEPGGGYDPYLDPGAMDLPGVDPQRPAV